MFVISIFDNLNMQKGEKAGAVGGIENQSPTKTQNSEETVTEVPDLECTDGVRRLEADLVGSCTIPQESESEHHRHREKCALFMEVELYRPFCNETGSRALPAHAWSEEIINDYVENEAFGLSQIIILNQKECLLFRGKRSKNEGYSWEEARRICNRISGQSTWVGKNAMIRVVPITLAEAKVDIAKARQFIRNQNLEKLAVRRLKDSKKEHENPMPTPVMETVDLPRMKRTPKRSDKLIMQQYRKHQESANESRELEEGCDSPNTPQVRRMNMRNAYYQARVTTDSSDSTLDEELDDQLDSDDIVAYDTETSRFTTVADRRRRERRDHRRAMKRERRTRQTRIKSHLTLPLFRDSKKEDAITYVDWHWQVQALIDRGIPARQMRDLVMEALEGPPKSDALSEYNQGDKSVHDILSVLDKVYGSETSYIALQSELCNMQQAYGETARAFYQRMTPIIVQIQEKHAGQLKEEELANTVKDAFYHGLREEYKPLIVHKLDGPGIKMSDLLQEVRKIERVKIENAPDTRSLSRLRT